MNIVDVVIWGGVATVALTVILQAATQIGLTRMNLPYILGMMLTPDRRKAPLYGGALHMLNGLVFALGYAGAFESLGRSSWWAGGLLGLVHAAAALTAMPLLGGVHPRMASAHDGPAARTALQPPGFLGLNYGATTPLMAVGAHVVYGLILGMFYTPI